MEQPTFFCRQDGAPSLSDDIRVCVMRSVCVPCAFKGMLHPTHEMGMSFPNDTAPTLEREMKRIMNGAI